MNILLDMETIEHFVKSRAYRLIEPGIIREVVLEHPFHEGQVVVEPNLASICHADLRYYTGQRRAEALARKLPMALLHEGVGRVVESKFSNLKQGQRVVIVPNLPGYMLAGIAPEDCCPDCRSGVRDNYCQHGRFLGSGMDGIAQQRLVVPGPCAIPIPDDVPDEIAVLSELCSVSHCAIDHGRDKLNTARVAIFGDGPVGYLTAAMLRHSYGLDHERLQVFGAVADRLNQFEFASRTLVQNCDFTSCAPVDVAFDCTGGRFSESAINQAIEILSPGGLLILMGVSEEAVPINTRDVLEKGITIVGSSRSSCKDFHAVLRVMRNPSCQTTLRSLLPEMARKVRTVDDFVSAMDKTASHREWKKTVLDFHW